MTFTTFKIIVATILISLRISCQGKRHDRLPKVEILKYPPSAIKVLTGSTINLFWRYRVEPIDRLKFTSWYYGTIVKNRLNVNLIMRKNHDGGGLLEFNPSLTDDKNNRTSCYFSLNDQIWTMRCRITNVNVDDSAIYGVQLKLDGIEEPILNATSVTVVDIMFNSQESDFILQSWIGRKTELNCAIHMRKIKLEIAYEWSVVTEDKDITRGIIRSHNKTSYTFIPLSKRDFGKYRCKIITASTKVEHTIVLQQIDYPGAPNFLQIQDVGDVRVYWERPSSNGGSEIIDYVVETRYNENEKWVNIGRTTKLSVAVTNVQKLNRYEIRVCSRNKIGIGTQSCTKAKTMHIGQIGKRNSGCPSIIPFRYIYLVWLILLVI